MALYVLMCANVQGVVIASTHTNTNYCMCRSPLYVLCKPYYQSWANCCHVARPATINTITASTPITRLLMGQNYNYTHTNVQTIIIVYTLNISLFS